MRHIPWFLVVSYTIMAIYAYLIGAALGLVILGLPNMANIMNYIAYNAFQIGSACLIGSIMLGGGRANHHGRTAEFQVLNDYSMPLAVIQVKHMLYGLGLPLLLVAESWHWWLCASVFFWRIWRATDDVLLLTKLYRVRLQVRA